MCAPVAPNGAYKCFAKGKTLPQAEFISAEEVKSHSGSPRGRPRGADQKQLDDLAIAVTRIEETPAEEE